MQERKFMATELINYKLILIVFWGVSLERMEWHQIMSKKTKRIKKITSKRKIKKELIKMM